MHAITHSHIALFGRNRLDSNRVECGSDDRNGGNRPAVTNIRDTCPISAVLDRRELSRPCLICTDLCEVPRQSSESKQFTTDPASCRATGKVMKAVAGRASLR
jgi:hypothetical protein